MLAFAPAIARELEARLRSKTLPLSCVGQSISEINTNPRWSSQSTKGSAKVVELPCSEGCHLLCSKLRSPASIVAGEKHVSGRVVRAFAASPALIEPVGAL